MTKLRLNGTTDSDESSMDEFRLQMLQQINKNLEEEKYPLLETFFYKNSANLVTLFNKLL
jgi:hypothetical protein